MSKKNFTTIALLVSLFFSVSCSSGSSNYLIDGLGQKTNEQKELLFLLEKNPENQETRFALMNKIATNLLLENNKPALIVFLTSAVENNPDNPYNAYWLLMVAHSYLQDEAYEIAEYFLNRILENYPDLEIHGKSIHLMSLENLIKITESPEMHIRYYSELITRFEPEIDLGYSYFMLARSYEKLGEWQLAIQTYMQFLSYGRFDIVIPGIPDSYEYAKKLVDYNTSSKDWIFETLDDLVQSITKAISVYDYRSLEKYRAKVNFFAMSWKQESSDTNSQADFHMRDFMGGNRVRYNDTLDSSSNPHEAYLRTSGWSQYVSVWYLYFRKINFPADPNIHGCWEWAGIYYGEKL